MAESDEKLPLLDNDDDSEVISGPRRQIKNLFESDRVLGRHSAYVGGADGAINITASTSVQNFTEADRHIVS